MTRKYTVIQSNWNDKEKRYEEIVIPGMGRHEIKRVGSTEFLIIWGEGEEHTFVLDHVRRWVYVTETEAELT